MAREKGVKGQHVVRLVEAADVPPPPTSVDVPLFEIEEMPRLEKGQEVTAETIWGDEICTILAVDLAEGVVSLRGESGDHYYLSIGRVKRL